ncbi:Aste57867_6479 [Aphanomyces stellatus]|uniref:Aste57867_6479 protein n=2 Tax=Aphanomyces stellatus TaxID=120398 RepID=A0A485KHU4_9STRA|nr:hypothetical protein As57867_006463 [Aphanomyces stellatus]VFT83467.1 Aste57867_6479 [Aphanomyces stellatus]
MSLFRYYRPSTAFDYVRPSFWYPMASMEQSLMDIDALVNDMTMAAFPLRTHSLLTAPLMNEDDDFFKDLPVAARGTPATESIPAEAASTTRAFSNYSYSSASVVDDKGRRVHSVRRRYEDSNGRLKAVHERTMDGKTVVTTWNKAHKDDEGTTKTLCSAGTTVDDFETQWKDTPFAKAHESAEPLVEQAKPASIENKEPAKATA